MGFPRQADALCEEKQALKAAPTLQSPLSHGSVAEESGEEQA